MINITEVKGIKIIEVTGRMDGDSSPVIGQALDDIIDSGHGKLVLDLGSVDYISSPGLREVVRVYKRAQQIGGDLRLANPSERVMAVFELAGLDTLLNIYDSDVAAINSFN